ncbi:hypothetical protein IWQ62_000025 [Dispira parvispora]|uniref:Multiple inositol polyphosphate phosphatase 1 n=1 Tax=Dispira parvispora TaxID=1520584 RepID=A0A9W8B1K2_9FUNG|nr:hypothetical protein IWQ62_000025 [Dispira parvispora]
MGCTRGYTRLGQDAKPRTCYYLTFLGLVIAVLGVVYLYSALVSSGQHSNPAEAQAHSSTFGFPWPQPRLLPFGSKSPYPHQLRNQTFTQEPSPPPIGLSESSEQCRLVQVQMVIRHGSRNPNQGTYDDFTAVLDKLRKHWKNSDSRPDPRVAWLLSYQPHYRTGLSSLTAIGRKDLHRLANRVYHRYKDFWDSLYPVTNSGLVADTRNLVLWHTSSSDYNRTIESMYTFMGELFQEIERSSEVIPSLDEGYQVDIVPRDMDRLLNPHYGCDAWRDISRGPTGKAHIYAERKHLERRHFPAIMSRLKSLLGYSKLTPTDVYTLYKMCAFDNANHPERRQTPCILFEGQEEELAILEYWGEFRYYQQYGYGAIRPFARRLSCVLMESILEEMDQCSTPDLPPLDGRKSCQRGRFWFGHSATIAFLSNYLGLDMDEQGDMSGDVPLDHIRNRTFQSSRMVPFSANIAFELYQCSTNDPSAPKSRYQIRVMRNEEPVVPNHTACDQVTGICQLDQMRWDSSGAQQCDLPKVCHLAT